MLPLIYVPVLKLMENGLVYFCLQKIKSSFFIPKNFAHGFLVLSDYAEFAYKCTDFYHPGDEGGLLWSDETIGVQWPIEEGMELIISEKDKKWGGFNDTFKFER